MPRSLTSTVHQWRKGLTLLLCLCAGTLAAQIQGPFEAASFYMQKPGWNTLVLFQLNPTLLHVDPASGQLISDLDMRIDFRPRQGHQVVLSRSFRETIRHDFLGTGNDFQRQYTFQLPPGSYAVDIEARDRQSRRLYVQTLYYDCRAAAGGYALSDIGLEQVIGGAFRQYVPGRLLNPRVEQVYFTAEAYAGADEMLTARAILYRTSTDGLTEGLRDLSPYRVEGFSSLLQQNYVVPVRGGVARVQGNMDLSGLGAGDYLLEIYLYADEVLVAEENRAFSVEFPELARIFREADSSIAQVQYLTTPAELAQLQSTQDPELRQQRFLEFWEARRNPGEADGRPAMQRWYARIYAADTLFQENDLPGWRSLRGRYYCLYGPPDQIEPITWQGAEMEGWLYRRWNLRLVFRLENGVWRCLNP